MLATKTPIATTTMEITTALVCLDTMVMAQFAQVGFTIIRGVDFATQMHNLYFFQNIMVQPVDILTDILVLSMSHMFSFLLPHNLHFNMVSKRPLAF